MTKKNKYIGGGILVLLLILAFVFRKQIKEKASNLIAGKKEQGSNTTSTTKTEKAPTATTLLKNGSSGDLVKELQQLLNKDMANHPTIDLPPLVEDGIFGAKTEAMLSAITGLRSISVVTFKKEHAHKA